MIVLDTNVVSEVMRPLPAEQVAAWLARQPVANLAITAVSVAEILYGIRRLPDGRRRIDLARRFDAFLDRGFRGRILPFDARGAEIYADIVADRRRTGRPIGVLDAMIASIALTAGAEIATRDNAGFENCGVALIDPWATQ